MKSKLYILPVIIALFFMITSCATSSYDTARFKEPNINISNIAFSKDGLSKDQIESILATKFPPDKPVSISLFFLATNSRYREIQYDPTLSIIKKIDNTTYIKRIVPVPKIMMPDHLTFDTIQEIGIRSLSEYSIILYGDSEKVFWSYKSPFGHYMTTSTLDFLLIDNKTTAIIASDKLFSEFQTPIEFFSEKQFQINLQGMYQEQANLLYEKLMNLFKR